MGKGAERSATNASTQLSTATVNNEGEEVTGRYVYRPAGMMHVKAR